MPQAPDKTSRWTTLVRLAGFPPSSILQAWEGGTGWLRALPLAFSPWEPAQGQGHRQSSRYAGMAAQEEGSALRQPDPISLNVSPQALRLSGPQHPCHLRHPQVSAPPAQTRSPRAPEITSVPLKYHLGVPVLTAKTPAPITRPRYLYEGPQSTPAPSNAGKPPNLIPKTPSRQ